MTKRATTAITRQTFDEKLPKMMRNDENDENLNFLSEFDENDMRVYW